MISSRDRTKGSVLGILSSIAQAGAREDDISVRLVAPLVGAELGTWKVSEKNGIAHLEIDESGGGQETVNVALTNAPMSSSDEDTGVSVVVNSGNHALVKRSTSNWVYLTYENSTAEDAPKLFADDSGDTKSAQKSEESDLKPTASARKLADLAKKNKDYDADRFLDHTFKCDDELLMKSLAYVRSKLFSLKLNDDDLIYLLSRDVIDRKSARKALKWNAFVAWATPIIEGKEEIPDSVSTSPEFSDTKCLTRTAKTDERIWPKSYRQVVQFNDGIDLNSFLRTVNDDWYNGKLSSAQVDLLNQMNFMISGKHGSRFGVNQVQYLLEIAAHVSAGGSIYDSEIAENKIKTNMINNWRQKLSLNMLDESLLLVLGLLGIGPCFEWRFRAKRSKTSEASSEQPLEAPTSGQNDEDRSEYVPQPSESQRLIKRPAARKDKPKPADSHVGLAETNTTKPFGTSLLSDLTEGSSFHRNQPQAKRSRTRRKQ